MDQFIWLKPWQPVAADNGLVEELQREISTEHPLFGRIVVAIGQRCDTDDVLFRIEGHATQFAVVHLTWSVESDPEFPWTQFYTSMPDFGARMRRDHEHWTQTRNRP